MSTLYLIEANNNVLANSAINNVMNLQDGTYPIRGTFPVLLPFDVPLEGVPTGLNDLVTKKYQGMLALYPGYTNILFNEMNDVGGWETSVSFGTGLRHFGARKTVSLGPAFTALQSTVTNLGFAPTNAILRWQVFSYEITDVGVDGEISRVLREEDPAFLNAAVVFNGGIFPSNGVPFTIPVGIQSSNVYVTFNNTPHQTERLYLASWALIYL